VEEGVGGEGEEVEAKRRRVQRKNVFWRSRGSKRNGTGCDSRWSQE
jgi:hypothetical protein